MHYAHTVRALCAMFKISFEPPCFSLHPAFMSQHRAFLSRRGYLQYPLKSGPNVRGKGMRIYARPSGGMPNIEPPLSAFTAILRAFQSQSLIQVSFTHTLVGEQNLISSLKASCLPLKSCPTPRRGSRSNCRRTARSSIWIDIKARHWTSTRMPYPLIPGHLGCWPQLIE